jgi:hypothetical protein
MAISSKKVVVSVLVVVIALVIVEVALRQFFGLGDMLLFQADSSFEYIAQPNQDKTRFGNRILSNEYSMRSLPLKGSDTCIVLGFGDSILNGGSLTDQDSVATAIVENRFQQGGANSFRFLNVSAGSWGPDNCAAYLKRYGAFGAKMIVLFVSSHDAHDMMTFENTVGVHESYPDKQFPLAMGELMVRYVWPRFINMIGQAMAEEKPNDLMINKNGTGFNSGFEFFLDYTQKNNIPFLICLHAEKIEVEQGKFNSQGQEILKFCSDNNIKVITGLEIAESVKDFRDGIHLNARGQGRWAEALIPEIRKTVQSCL